MKREEIESKILPFLSMVYWTLFWKKIINGVGGPNEKWVRRSIDVPQNKHQESSPKNP